MVHKKFIVKRMALATVLMLSGGGIVTVVSDSSSLAKSLLYLSPLKSTYFESSTREKLTKINNPPQRIKRDRISKALLQPPEGKEREKTALEAEKIRKILKDYTFKLFTPCGYGTGWILDYQIPKEKGTYPTIWYIATNAHVLKKFRTSDNSYRQLLPKTVEEVKAIRERENYADIKEKYRNISLDSEGEHCSSTDRYAYFDLNLSWGKEGEKRDANYGAVGLGQMEEPKLFFSAFDFLDRKTSGLDGHHYIDFAVLELKFTNQENAKIMTDNFARKYPVKTTKNIINIFEKPLEEKYDEETLDTLDENFYILAYPENRKNRWKSAFNFDLKSGIATRLSNRINPQKKKRMKRGLVKAAEIAKKIENFWWGGRMFKEIGHHYEMQYNPLGQGSSGGLLVDKRGGVIGITGLTTVGKGASTSWFAPLRSSGITLDDNIVTPSYDLILGVKGQKNSYRQQVMRYITSKGNKTWLSSRGWKERYGEIV